MTYRLTIQHDKNNDEKSVTIIDNKEDAKMEYLKSCEKRLFYTIRAVQMRRVGKNHVPN